MGFASLFPCTQLIRTGWLYWAGACSDNGEKTFQDILDESGVLVLAGPAQISPWHYSRSNPTLESFRVSPALQEPGTHGQH